VGWGGAQLGGVGQSEDEEDGEAECMLGERRCGILFPYNKGWTGRGLLPILIERDLSPCQLLNRNCSSACWYCWRLSSPSPRSPARQLAALPNTVVGNKHATSATTFAALRFQRPTFLTSHNCFNIAIHQAPQVVPFAILKAGALILSPHSTQRGVQCARN